MMQKKFLKEVVTLTVGKPAEIIAEILDSKKHVNEFIIAKKMDITINQARNILYKLSDFGLVSSIRKKDKKKGWYTYFWKIEILKSLEFMKKMLSKRIGQLESQMKSRESKTFYSCERCNVEFNEENALTYDFTCNECGDIFAIKDNSKILRDIKRHFDKLKRELSLVEEEIEKEMQNVNKQKEKESKKLKAEEDLKKKSAREKRLALKKAEKKSMDEKSIKKVKNVVKKLKKKSIKKKSTNKKIKKSIKKTVKKKSIKKVKNVVKKKVKKETKKKLINKKVVRKKSKK